MKGAHVVLLVLVIGTAAAASLAAVRESLGLLVIFELMLLLVVRQLLGPGLGQAQRLRLDAVSYVFWVLFALVILARVQDLLVRVR
ncbi:MAG: hypothetical protein ACPGQL_03815 [Thermoplasmatota archaeon]